MSLLTNSWSKPSGDLMIKGIEDLISIQNAMIQPTTCK